MARVAMVADSISRAGVAATYAAVTVDGISFVNSEREFLHVKNGGAGATVVTLQTVGFVDGIAIPDRSVSIPAGEERFIGPFSAAYTRTTDANVYVDFSVLTSVTVALLQLSRG
jgi:hypothetical protein